MINLDIIMDKSSSIYNYAQLIEVGGCRYLYIRINVTKV